MLEMSKEHIKYIPEVVYLYLDQTELSDSVKNYAEVMRATNEINSKPLYDELYCLFRDFNDECVETKEYVVKASR